jgi:hypothetical protein
MQAGRPKTALDAKYRLARHFFLTPVNLDHPITP